MHGLIGRSERRDEIHITHLGSEDVGASLLKPWRWGLVLRMALRNARNNNVGGWNRTTGFAFLRRWIFRIKRMSMSNANNYRQQAEEAAARVQWCEKKLLFERKRHKALKELATGEDWLDGKISPLPKTESVRSSGG